MTRNKILGAAIAAALSMGSGLAYAVPGTFVGPVDIAPCTGAPGHIPAAAGNTKVALELFDSSSTDDIRIPATTVVGDGNYCFSYTIAETTAITTAFKVTYTLSNALFTVKEPKLVIDHATPHAPYASFIQDAVAANSDTITFNIDPTTNNVDPGDRFTLDTFDIKVVENEFATPGKKATITISFTEGVGDTQTKTLMETAAGTTVTFTKGTDEPEIDVSASSFKFTPTAAGDNNAARAVIGTVQVTGAPTDIYNLDMNQTAATWAIGTPTGSLNITSGPFSSLDSRAQVFIEDGDTNCDHVGSPIDATLNGEQATFSIASVAFLATQKNICIVVPDDNSVQIDETDEAPQASVTVNHAQGSVTSSTATLWHLQNNGAVCTVYNVTDGATPGPSDTAYLRITNLGSAPATVMGTLVGQTGQSVFEGVDLGVFAENQIPPIEGVASGQLNAKATLVLNSGHLDTIARDPLLAANPQYPDFKRGVLTVTSTAKKGTLEVYALLRADNKSLFDALGGTFEEQQPQMNMSAGGTLKGCNN